jgi:hypothetical protein
MIAYARINETFINGKTSSFHEPGLRQLNPNLQNGDIGK